MHVEPAPEADTILDLIHRHQGRAPVWRFPHSSEAWPLDRLLERASQGAGTLLERGLRRGDRVGLALATGPDYVALLLALWQLAAVAVPLRAQAGKGPGYGEHLASVDEICRLRWIVADEPIPLRPGHAGLAARVIAAADVFGPGTAHEPTALHPTRADTAVLQMTSGSTSRPRAVVVTHGMIMDQLAFLSASGRAYSGHAVRSAASWLPLNHDMGLFTGVLWPLYDGADNLCAPPAFYMRDPRRWFRLLGQHRVDMNFATNTSAAAACRALSRATGSDAIDLSALQLYFGAEKLHARVLDRVERTLGPLGLSPAQVHVGYGMAENALAATRSPPGPVRRVSVTIDARGTVAFAADAGGKDVQEIVSVGAPFAGYECQIRDPSTGARLPELALGEVHLSGPCLFPGYFGDPGSTAERLRLGFLRTGDLGFLHDGELFFVGREDDLVNLGGRKLVPDDVEHIVEALPFVGVGRSCFLGVEGADSGATAPLLLIEAADTLPEDQLDERAAAIRRALLDRLDLLIGQILFCPKGTVEKTSSGKKRRKVIRERYLSGELPSIRGNARLGPLPQPV